MYSIDVVRLSLGVYFDSRGEYLSKILNTGSMRDNFYIRTFNPSSDRSKMYKPDLVLPQDSPGGFDKLLKANT